MKSNTNSSTRPAELGRPYHYRSLLVMVSVMSCVSLALAQTAAPTVAPGATEEVLELSPFVVEASANSYVAKSTLGSTRIRSDVADVGSSISILTEQLIEDLAGTDAGSLLNIVPNMEVAGALGNFSNSSKNDDAFLYQSTEARTNSNLPQRSRGLVSAQNTRNYFQTIVPLDSYSISRVTINRGPNSVLFGLGSPGGVIESSMSMPLQKNQTKVSISASNYGGLREIVDINRVLFDGRLKVRGIMMNEEKRFRQEEAFDNDRRGFFAWDYKLHKAKRDAFIGDTTVRGYVEAGKRDRNPPDAMPPTVNYQYWYDTTAAQSLVGKFPGVNTLADLGSTSLYSNAQLAGGTFVPKATINAFAAGQGGKTNVFTPPFIALVSIYDQPNALTPGINGYTGYMPRTRWANPRGTQDQRFTESKIGNDFPGFASPTLMDRNVFDFVNHLFSGDTDRLSEKFNIQEFTVEQEFWQGKLGIEASYNRQSMDNYQNTPYSANRARRISIDVSELTPMPAVPVPTPAKSTTTAVLPNPNVGRPSLAVNNFVRSNATRDLESSRLTAYFKHDFKENFDGFLGKLLGNHALGFLASKSTDRNKKLGEGLNRQSDELDLGAADLLNHPYNQQRRQTQTFVYIGDDVRGTSGPGEIRLKLPLSYSVVPQAGADGKFTYWDNNSAQKRLKEVSAYNVWVPDAAESNFSKQRVASDAYILQSHWLDDHLVTLFAIRNDSVRNYEVRQEAKSNLVDGSMDLTAFHLQDTPASDLSGRTTTKSFVLKFPEKYLFALPFDSDLRLTYFESGTFDPVKTGRTLDNSILPNPNGTTKEYGFGLDLFNRRLSLTVNWYETSANGARNATAMGALENWAGPGGTWLTRANDFEQLGNAVTAIPGNEDGHIPSWDALYTKISTLLPSSYRDNITVNFNRADGSITGTGIEGLTSTYDYVSKGMEIELGGAITKNWNIVFNAAKQETVQSNTLPGVAEFAEQVSQNIIAAGLATVNDAPALGVTGNYLQRWQNNVVFPVLAQKAKDGQKSPEQRKWRWNLITSYNFDDGRLKGFTVGAVARWQDKAAIGYPVILDEGGNLVNDIKNPYYGETEFNADAFVSYRRKLTKTINWKVQLNVRNFIGGNPDHFIPVSIDPVGNVQAIRTSPERQILLTNTFTF